MASSLTVTRNFEQFDCVSRPLIGWQVAFAALPTVPSAPKAYHIIQIRILLLQWSSSFVAREASFKFVNPAPALSGYKTLFSIHSILQGDAATDATSNGKRLRNQFNFSERGIQTTFYPPRERGTNTEVPEIAEASGTCSQWEIYDAYVADQLMQKQQVRL